MGQSPEYVLEKPERLIVREFDLPRISADDALLEVHMAGFAIAPEQIEVASEEP